MPLIRPFRGLRPVTGRADEVVAPPYDVLSSAEARERAAGRPNSFLHISKPEIDLPPETDPFDPTVYAKGAENFQRMIADGVLRQDDEALYYVYRLTMGEQVQTGLVAVANVVEYDRNRVRRHEFTRPDKEDDRVRQIEALNAQTGPVFCVYPDHDEVDALLAAVTQEPHEADITADDGVRHEFWCLRDRVVIDRITALFDAMDAIYIADGHHRSASASRVAASRRINGSVDDEAAAEYFLTVIFPRHQMAILDYNRVVADLNGLDREALLARAAESFDVALSDMPVKPAKSGEYGMYVEGTWYRLTIREELIPSDPVGRLEVSLLHDRLIEPVLGIANPRTDKRVDFVGGIRGLGELEKRVNSGDWAVAFSLFPTSMSALMAVADADEVMPPKSTWFEPKLADGLVSHVLD
ncbi:MAG: DUF1015 domain-containing protein [Gammaproteobacteria bacterium]